jgi:hypothetical protein
MINSRSFGGRNCVFILCLTALFLIIFAVDGIGNTGKSGIQFNPAYKLKSHSGIVTVYTFDEKGEKIEYSFHEFNADVLLLLYRRLELNDIVNRMSDKYGMSQKESRRNVKMTINRLELWDIVIRD